MTAHTISATSTQAEDSPKYSREHAALHVPLPSCAGASLVLGCPLLRFGPPLPSYSLTHITARKRPRTIQQGTHMQAPPLPIPRHRNLPMPRSPTPPQRPQLRGGTRCRDFCRHKIAVPIADLSLNISSSPARNDVWCLHIPNPEHRPWTVGPPNPKI